MMPKYSYPVSVRARLLKLGRTQQDLARALGYSPSYISMVLSGRHPAPAIRQRIADLLEKWEAKG